MKRSCRSTIKGAISFVLAMSMSAMAVPQAAFASQDGSTMAGCAEESFDAASVPGSASYSRADSRDGSGNGGATASDSDDRADEAAAGGSTAANADPHGDGPASSDATDRQLPDGSDAASTDEPVDVGIAAADAEQPPMTAFAAPTIACYPSKAATTVDFRAHGGAFATASSIRFAVWSDENGQDDLVWYGGTKLGDDLWGLTIPLSNHGSYGTYQVHAYDASTAPHAFVAAGSFSVVAPKASLEVTQSEAQARSGMFTVTISDVSNPDAIDRFKVPIWSDANHQDDLVWHDATRVSNGVWKVDAACVGGNRAPGKYTVHVYALGKNGILSYVDGAEAELDSAESNVSVALSGDESRAKVTFSGPAAMRSTRVQFPTWSDEGDQDDLVWYEGTRLADGSWQANVEIARHATAGKYFSHVYSTSETGTGFAGEATFDVSQIEGSIKVIGSENGQYTVEVTVARSPSGVIQVQVPTWTDSNDQDDLVWHDATKVSANVWRCEVSAGDHNGEEGSYNTHAYATGANGVRSFVGEARSNVSCRNFAFVRGPIGSGWREVCVKNPTSSDIKVAVWTDEGGHDDLSWYPSAYVGDNVYVAKVDCHGMRHGGSATVHVYIAGFHATSVAFWVSAEDLMPAEYGQMHDIVSGVGSATGYLIGVDTNSCRVGIFTGSAWNWSLSRSFACAPGKASTPTVKGHFTVGSKGYVFGSGYSCYYWTQFYGNYLFHSILYNPGTFDVQDPTMGTPVSHGCVRLEIENAKWIYDNIPYGTKVVVY